MRAHEVTDEIGKILAEKTGENRSRNRSKAFLVQRTSLALQRGNSD